MKIRLTGWVGGRLARLVAACVAAAFVLQGCGGDDNAASATPPATGTPTVTVSGRVLDKKPVAEATVYLFLSGTPLGTATTDADGYYSYTVDGATKLTAGAPLDAVVLGREIPLVSNNIVPPEAANGLAGSVKIVSYLSPLTTLLSALASQSGRPYIAAPAAATASEAAGLLPAAADSYTISDDKNEFAIKLVESLSKVVDVIPPYIVPAPALGYVGAAPDNESRESWAKLTEKLSAVYGSLDDPVSYIATSTFSETEWADSYALTLSSIEVSWSSDQDGLTIAPWGLPDSAQELKGLVSPEPLEVPPVESSFQDRMLAHIDSCLASAGAACDIGTSVDSAYVHDGLTFQQRLASVPTGTRVRDVSTLRLLEAADLAVLGSDRGALVKVRMEGPDGTPMVWNDVVRLTNDNEPVLVGNGVQYPIVVSSFLGRKQTMVPGLGASTVYENGLDFRIPSSVERDGTPVQVGSAKVEGAGLPAGGLYLVSTSSGELTLPATPATEPWVDCGSCPRSDGVSTQFKWDRRTLDGTAVDSTSYDYVPATSITSFGVYRVSLYDTSGVPIGMPQSAVNFGATVSASNGKTVGWPTLDPDLVAQFLTPGGSLAGPQSAVTVKWQLPSGLEDYDYGIFSTTVAAVDSPAQFGFVQAYSADGVPVAPVRGTVDYASLVSRVNGVTRQDIAAQSARQIRLAWGAVGSLYTGTWAYRPQ